MNTLPSNAPPLPARATKRDGRKKPQFWRKHTVNLPWAAILQIEREAESAVPGMPWRSDQHMAMAIVNWLAMTPEQRRSVATDVYEPWLHDRIDRCHRAWEEGGDVAAEAARPIGEVLKELPAIAETIGAVGTVGAIDPLRILVNLVHDMALRSGEQQELCNHLVAVAKAHPTVARNIRGRLAMRGLAPWYAPALRLAGEDE